jgi:pilus assembly protein Flp/PilA
VIRRQKAPRRPGARRSFLRDEKGATAIEYALIAALVSVAILVALEALGTSLGGLYNSMSSKVTAVLS